MKVILMLLSYVMLSDFHGLICFVV